MHAFVREMGRNIRVWNTLFDAPQNQIAGRARRPETLGVAVTEVLLGGNDFRRIGLREDTRRERRMDQLGARTDAVMARLAELGITGEPAAQIVQRLLGRPTEGTQPRIGELPGFAYANHHIDAAHYRREAIAVLMREGRLSEAQARSVVDQIVPEPRPRADAAHYTNELHVPRERVGALQRELSALAERLPPRPGRPQLSEAQYLSEVAGVLRRYTSDRPAIDREMVRTQQALIESNERLRRAAVVHDSGVALDRAGELDAALGELWRRRSEGPADARLSDADYLREYRATLERFAAAPDRVTDLLARETARLPRATRNEWADAARSVDAGLSDRTRQVLSARFADAGVRRAMIEGLVRLLGSSEAAAQYLEQLVARSGADDNAQWQLGQTLSRLIGAATGVGSQDPDLPPARARALLAGLAERAGDGFFVWQLEVALVGPPWLQSIRLAGLEASARGDTLPTAEQTPPAVRALLQRHGELMAGQSGAPDLAVQQARGNALEEDLATLSPPDRRVAELAIARAFFDARLGSERAAALQARDRPIAEAVARTIAAESPGTNAARLRETIEQTLEVFATANEHTSGRITETAATALRGRLEGELMRRLGMTREQATRVATETLARLEVTGALGLDGRTTPSPADLSGTPPELTGTLRSVDELFTNPAEMQAALSRLGGDVDAEVARMRSERNGALPPNARRIALLRVAIRELSRLGVLGPNAPRPEALRDILLEDAFMDMLRTRGVFFDWAFPADPHGADTHLVQLLLMARRFEATGSLTQEPRGPQNVRELVERIANLPVGVRGRVWNALFDADGRGQGARSPEALGEAIHAAITDGEAVRADGQRRMQQGADRLREMRGRTAEVDRALADHAVEGAQAAAIREALLGARSASQDRALNGRMSAVRSAVETGRREAYRHAATELLTSPPYSLSADRARAIVDAIAPAPPPRERSLARTLGLDASAERGLARDVDRAHLELQRGTRSDEAAIAYLRRYAEILRRYSSDEVAVRTAIEREASRLRTDGYDVDADRAVAAPQAPTAETRAEDAAAQRREALLDQTPALRSALESAGLLDRTRSLLEALPEAEHDAALRELVAAANDPAALSARLDALSQAAASPRPERGRIDLPPELLTQAETLADTDAAWSAWATSVLQAIGGTPSDQARLRPEIELAAHVLRRMPAAERARALEALRRNAGTAEALVLFARSIAESGVDLRELQQAGPLQRETTGPRAGVVRRVLDAITRAINMLLSRGWRQDLEPQLQILELRNFEGGAGRAAALEAVRTAVAAMPRSARGDLDLLARIAVQHPSLLIAMPELATNRDFVLAALRLGGERNNLQALIGRLGAFYGDREVMLLAVQRDGSALRLVTGAAASDPAIALAAVRNDGLALQYARGANRELVLAAITQNPEAILFAPEAVQREPGFAEEAAEHGSIVSFGLSTHPRAAAIYARAVEVNGMALRSVPAPLLAQHPEWIESGLRQNGRAAELANVEQAIAANPQLALTAVRATPDVVFSLPDAMLQAHPELLREALARQPALFLEATGMDDLADARTVSATTASARRGVDVARRRALRERALSDPETVAFIARTDRRVISVEPARSAIVADPRFTAVVAHDPLALDQLLPTAREHYLAQNPAAATAYRALHAQLDAAGIRH
jgi:hypothetical protein